MSMLRKYRYQASFLLILFIAIHPFTCSSFSDDKISTPEDREALFDYILEKTLQREAFSPIKNQRLDLDVEQEMRKYREEMIAADTDEKLYYTLVKISNARKDRHLKVSLVAGGLTLPDATGVSLSNYPEPGSAIPHAPIRFAVDFEKEGDYFVFVGDYAKNLADYTDKNRNRLKVA